MPTENEKRRQSQHQDSGGDKKRGGMGERSGQSPVPDPEWEEEPGNAKDAAGDAGSEPWRDRQEGDTNRNKK